MITKFTDCETFGGTGGAGMSVLTESDICASEVVTVVFTGPLGKVSIPTGLLKPRPEFVEKPVGGREIVSGIVTHHQSKRSLFGEVSADVEVV